MSAQFSRTLRSMTAERGLAAHVAWTTAALLLGGWLFWFFSGSVTVYEVSRRARLEVQQSAHPLAAPRAARVLVQALAIGQVVRAGDVLVELDAGAERLRLQEERVRLHAIPLRIGSLRKEIALREQARQREQRAAHAATQSGRFRIEEANAAVEFARDQERRLKEESQHGSIAHSEALRALAEARKLGASRDALGADIVRLESEAQTRESNAQALIENLHRTVAGLEGEMATIGATIQRLELDIERHRVRAPVDGRIGELAVLNAGSWVAEGQKLASVVPSGELRVVAWFEPSAVLGRVRPGQPARMRLDGFPWAQFGSVASVVSAVASEIQDGMVRVEFAPQADALPTLPLQHGLPGAVEIAIEQASPAQMVLRAAGLRLSRPAPTAPVAASQRSGA